MSIGSRIKDARISKGLKQEDLARLIGVTKGAVGNYEADYSSPKDIVLYKIFEVLNVDANYIFQDNIKNKKTPPPLTAEENNLINQYRELNTTGQKMLIEQATMMTASGLYKKSDNITFMAARNGNPPGELPENPDELPDAPDTI